MTLTNAEAEAALATIEATETRTRQLERYRRGSPYLLLWGAIWLVGFSTTDLAPHLAPLVWSVLQVLGVAGTAFLMIRGRRPGPRAQQRMLRSLAIAGLAIVFAIATAQLMRPRDPQAGLAFTGLITGTIYAAMGVFIGLRWFATGLAMIALSLAGHALLGAHYALWMAVVCGGGLILAGLWLREV